MIETMRAIISSAVLIVMIAEVALALVLYVVWEGQRGKRSQTIHLGQLPPLPRRALLPANRDPVIDTLIIEIQQRKREQIDRLLIDVQQLRAAENRERHTKW